MTNVTLIHGPPNSGKTTRALRMAGDGAVVYTPEPESVAHVGMIAGTDHT
jgi:hypothetical protein